MKPLHNLSDLSAVSLLALALAMTSAATTVAQQAQFVAIPGTSPVPGTNPNFCGVSGTAGYSGVRVSADGTTVATVVYEPGFSPGAVDRRAARWRAATGTIAISPILQGNYGVVGISSDGQTVYGETWRWRASNGYQDLRPLLSNAFGQLTRALFGCSYDGLTVAGIEGYYPSQGDMLRWTIGTGAPQLLPRDPGFPEGYYFFNTISGDGLVLAGSTRRFTTSPFGSDTYAGVIVTPTGTNVITPEGGQAGVTGLSSDGAVAVGYLTNGAVLRAFRWDSVAGLIELVGPSLGTSDSTYARATNFDGSVIVGDYLNFGTPGTLAFTWTAAGGFVDLRDDLVNNYGLGNQLAGWQLLTATDVSLDGRTIVGQGVNPAGCEQAFLVRFPLVPATAVAYGTGCAGGAGPLALTTNTLPYVGQTFTSECSGGSSTTLGIAVYGLTQVALPLATVLPQGLPGCLLLTSPEVTSLTATNGSTVTASLAIPDQVAFVGAQLQQQIVQLQFATNGGLQTIASSNGLSLTIGSF